MEDKTLKKNQRRGMKNIPRTKHISYLAILLMLFFFKINYVQAQYIETDKVVALDRAMDDEFGTDVKIINNYAVIGAKYHDALGLSNAGAAYVYKRSGTTWTQIQELRAKDPKPDDWFGQSVSISYNGQYIVVGAPGQDTDQLQQNSYSNSGAAYFFKRSLFDDSYTQIAKIVAVDAQGNSYREADAFFGYDVDIFMASANKSIIVGAYGETHDISLPSANNSGAAYIFKPNSFSGNWNYFKKLTASDRAGGDKFGFSVAVHDKHAIVGAMGNNLDENNINPLPNAGAAYVFEDFPSSPWKEKDKLTSTATDRGAGERFGFSVDIGDIQRVIVGVPYDDEDENEANPISKAGSAFIFNKISSDDWQIESKIVAVDNQGNSDRHANDYFGLAVATDKNMALVGSPENEFDENGGHGYQQAGAAYLFEYAPGGNWNFQQKLVSSDRDFNDRLGYSVDIFSDRTLLGAHYEEHDDAVPVPGDYKDKAGSAYFYLDDQGKTAETLPFYGNSPQREALSIHPNPTDGLFVLESKKEMLSWNLSNQLGTVNFDGKVKKNEPNKASIDIRQLPTGVYFVKALFKDGEILARTIIKE